MNQYNKLRNFLAGYFHEDWAFDGSEPYDIVQLFIGETPSEDRRELANQIDAYVYEKGTTLSDADLFQEFGCYYSPGIDGFDAADWLRRVAFLLRSVN